MTAAPVEKKRPFPFSEAEAKVRRTPCLQTVLVIIGGLKQPNLAAVREIIREDISAKTFNNQDRALLQLATEDGYVAISALPISVGDLAARLPYIVADLAAMGLVTAEGDNLRLTAPNGEALYAKLTTPEKIKAAAIANESDEWLTR
jgi:hypothetical protein